ncbi:hypothetical protein HII17_08385 [Thalassotalea sp. M1531]|uniref:Uncharacterized protein n=1 Tax=Thalassotalea algicola TaxID=2716224 RepID=A0A7Y0Q774_9GAMM|nr:hypothetical protein [Thalassotalea algicola]NMP31577.1 hypothetical protein [Thalassotalea algicola]
MSKTAKIILLALATLFLVIGVMSSFHAKPYAELTNIETFDGTIYKLHCPTKGAAALSLVDSDFTYNLTLKFKRDYCDDESSQPLLGKKVSIKAVKVNDNYYQVYVLKSGEYNVVEPSEVEADQSSSTFGLYLLAFLLVSLVIYKSRAPSAK